MIADACSSLTQENPQNAGKNGFGDSDVNEEVVEGVPLQ